MEQEPKTPLPEPDGFTRSLNRYVTHLYRQRKRFMSEHLRRYELSGAKYMFLISLDHTPGISQDALAARLCFDKGSIARAAKRLEELGYIRRETDPADRRQNRLYLTDRGTELLPEIYGLLREWSGMLTAGFDAEERRTAKGLLERMMQNAKEWE